MNLRVINENRFRDEEYQETLLNDRREAVKRKLLLIRRDTDQWIKDLVSFDESEIEHAEKVVNDVEQMMSAGLDAEYLVSKGTRHAS